MGTFLKTFQNFKNIYFYVRPLDSCFYPFLPVILVRGEEGVACSELHA